jgi:ABC-type transporter Mla maintaining outer membrane lipid asymmetry ATPase subunit MlaF
LRYHRDLTLDAASRDTKPLLDLMELTPLAALTPANVSANWRQRAALARALVLKPELLLLDNPLAGLGTRHLQWWLRFLDRLWRGHEMCGGKPMTIVATTDDLRPWKDSQRQFALLRDRQFIPLGSWKEVGVSDNAVVKELLAAPLEATI